MASQIDRTRILYTNLKNNRGSAQFLAQINPTKVLNLVPMVNKNSGGSGIMNKTIQRVVVSSSQPQSQQLASAFRQTANANANSTQSAANALLSTNAGNTLIITTSTASDGSSIIFNDINTTTSTIANSINTNNSSQPINLGNLTLTASEKLNHNDGTSTNINR